MGQLGVRDELRALSKSEAIAWLERVLASPVTPDWGRLLYLLRADWAALSRWLELDKEHCLAASDAIALYAQIEEDPAPFPEGASPAHIKAAIELALHRYDNARIRKTLKAVTAAWPANNDSGGQLSLSPEVNTLAAILLGQSEEHWSRWKKALRLRSSSTASEAWHALLDVADGLYALIRADWRDPPEDVAARLSQLPILAGIRGVRQRSDIEGTLQEIIASQLTGEFRSHFALCEIDDGSDTYVLAVIRADRVTEFERLARALLEEQRGIRWLAPTVAA